VRALWRAITIVLLLALGGCFADQQQQLASCKLEAMRLYPNEETHAFGGGKIGEYMATCMETHGYKFTASPSACPYGGAFPTDARCYVPTSWIGRLMYRLETGD
jgi:hypothetical protein